MSQTKSDDPLFTEEQQGTVDFLGVIVGAQVAQLASTNDKILELKDLQIQRLRKQFLALWGIIEEATVMDRRTETRLHVGGFEKIAEMERDALRREESGAY